jgi:hypothetical protein
MVCFWSDKLDRIADQQFDGVEASVQIVMQRGSDDREFPTAGVSRPVLPSCIHRPG